jgi:hypothetical protein
MAKIDDHLFDSTPNLQLVAQMLVWPRHSSLYLLTQNAPSKQKSRKLRVGNNVECLYSGEVTGEDAYFPGVIARINSDGTYDVNYDDGDQEEGVNLESIRLPGGKKIREQETSKEKDKQGVATLLSSASNEHMKVRYAVLLLK